MSETRFLCACGQHIVAEGEWTGEPINCPSCGSLLRAHAALSCMENSGGAAAAPGLRLGNTAAQEVSELKNLLEAAELDKGEFRALLRECEESLGRRDEALKALHATHGSALAELDNARARITELQARVEIAVSETGQLAARMEQQSADSARQVAEIRGVCATLEEANKATEQRLQASQAELAEMEVLKARLEKDIDSIPNAREIIPLRSNALEAREALALAKKELSTLRSQQARSEGEIARLEGKAVKLALELSAAQHALSESKAEHDNQVLRGLVERLNEELQQYRYLPKRTRKKLARKSRAATQGGSFRWPWSRFFAISKG